MTLIDVHLPWSSLASGALALCVLAPLLWMVLAAGVASSALGRGAARWAWRFWGGAAVLAWTGTLGAVLLLAAGVAPPNLSLLAPSLPAAWAALLVQALGGVIGAFARRYLQGEPAQGSAVRGLASVLAAVHLLLLADHWLLLIGAWMAVGQALHGLLCFYPDRPFAQLAAHKKRVSDRLADVLLLLAALLAWRAVGSGSISAALAQPDAPGMPWAAVALALAVVLRMALVPLHGWLLQVMEAPTPVSALLHAGVVNLGGVVLIRFAPWLDASPMARGLLVFVGLGSALMAAFAMLTRISIKVRLAWSTVAQMGFLVLECGLGLYPMAALHLIGHSLYKANHFLAASSVVSETRERMLTSPGPVARASLLAAPWVSMAVVAALLHGLHGLHGATGEHGAWPVWWTAILALAWSPLLWLPADRGAAWVGGLTGLGAVCGLTVLAWLGHLLPLGVAAQPHPALGVLALCGMAVLHGGLLALQWRGGVWPAAHRWTYAGYYVDDVVTRLACRLWPNPWAAGAWRGRGLSAAGALHPRAVL